MNDSLPERIPLGSTDLQVSPLGMGTNAWGFKSRADPAKEGVLAAALEAGINFIDTAEYYQHGGSEKTLGILLKNRQQQVVLATKFFPYPRRLTRKDLVNALRGSLARLELPSLDLYMLHFPAPPVPFKTWVEALADAQTAGLTRAVGISNCNLTQTRQAHSILSARGLPLASNQVEFSLLNRAVERNGLLETCHELGITLVAYRPLGYGLLTGKYRPEDLPAVLHGRRITRATLQKVSPLVGLLGELANAHAKTPAQVALNWIVCKGALPIPGAKHPRQAAENGAALGWRLDPTEVQALDRASDQI